MVVAQRRGNRGRSLSYDLLGNKGISEAITAGETVTLQRVQQAWTQLCSSDLQQAVFYASEATLQLAGIDGFLTVKDIQKDNPAAVMERLDEWILNQKVDFSSYPLMPSVTKKQTNAARLWDQFWAYGISRADSEVLLAQDTMQTMATWLIPMTWSKCRPLRHTSIIAVMAIVTATQSYQLSLTRDHELSLVQLGNQGQRGKKRTEALRQQVALSSALAQKIDEVRNRILDAVVKPRVRDVSSMIRLHVLSVLASLLANDYQFMIERQWLNFIFAALADPSAVVRRWVLQTLHALYSAIENQPPAVHDHLCQMLEQWMPTIHGRVRDSDAKVSIAAMQCLRLKSFAPFLNTQQFEDIVDHLPCGRHAGLREQAAFFVNEYVFRDPGICMDSKMAKELKKSRAGNEDGAQKSFKELLDSLFDHDLSIYMLVHYISDWMPDLLPLTSRVVDAFWTRAPALRQWRSMVNLYFLDDEMGGQDREHVRARLALLHLFQACVKRAMLDFHETPEDTSLQLDDACGIFLKELPRFFEASKAELEQCLVISHITKMLVQHAASTKHPALADARTIAHILQEAFLVQQLPYTKDYCMQSLIALAQCSDAARDCLQQVSLKVHSDCRRLLQSDSIGEHAEDLIQHMANLTVLSNQVHDMTFGKIQMLNQWVALLEKRTAYYEGKLTPLPEQNVALAGRSQADGLQETKAAAANEAMSEATRNKSTPTEALVQDIKARGSQVGWHPNKALTLRLIEALVTTLAWYIRQAGSVRSTVSAQETVPFMFCRLRTILTKLVEVDRSLPVRFYAFCSYMQLDHLALGASHRAKQLLEANAAAPEWNLKMLDSGTIPKIQQYALGRFLCSLHQQALSAEELQSCRDTCTEKELTMACVGMNPPPSLNPLTSVEVWLKRAVSDPSDESEADNEHPMLLAVLASQMVVDSTNEQVYFGILGRVVMNLIRPVHPAALREVSLKLFRRFRESGKLTRLCAYQYWSVQKDMIMRLAKSSIFEAAILSEVFQHHWDSKRVSSVGLPPPHVEATFVEVLLDALKMCIDAGDYDLISIFHAWSDDKILMSEKSGEEIRRTVKSLCKEAEIDPRKNEHLIAFLGNLNPKNWIPRQVKHRRGRRGRKRKGGSESEDIGWKEQQERWNRGEDTSDETSDESDFEDEFQKEPPRPKVVIKGRCPLEHELAEFRTDTDEYGCNICGDIVPLDSLLYGCSECDYDICKVCLEELNKKAKGERKGKGKGKAKAKGKAKVKQKQDSGSDQMNVIRVSEPSSSPDPFVPTGRTPDRLQEGGTRKKRRRTHRIKVTWTPTEDAEHGLKRHSRLAASRGRAAKRPRHIEPASSVPKLGPKLAAKFPNLKSNH